MSVTKGHEFSWESVQIKSMNLPPNSKGNSINVKLKVGQMRKKKIIKIQNEGS